MKNSIIAVSILSLLISQNSIAEYMIKIPLEQNSVSFTDAEVTGYIGLVLKEAPRYQVCRK